MRTLASGCLIFTTSAVVLAGCGSEQPSATSPEIGDARAARTSNTDVAAPSNAVAVAISETRIDLTWQDYSDNESKFEIHRSTSGPAGPFTLYGSTSANVEAFSDQWLQAATQYCYELRAVRTTGLHASYSAFSNAACATTPAPPPPPPQQACCTTVIPLDSMTVRVRWRDQSYNEDGFRVYRSADGGTTWVVAGTTTTSVELVDSGVPNAELGVCYRVVAFNAAGDAPPTNVACTAPLAAPTLLTVTAIDSQTLDIRWRDNSAIEDTYQVWAETSWSPVCTGICDAVVYTYDWMVVELPANSTSYRCTNCSDVALWIVAKKGSAVAWSDWWSP